jgi:hypothetical protein
VQRELVAELPRASFIEYSESGHFLFFELPLAFAKAVTMFLRVVSNRLQYLTPHGIRKQSRNSIVLNVSCSEEALHS